MLSAEELAKAPKSIVKEKLKKYNQLCEYVQDMQFKKQCFSKIEYSKPDFEDFYASIKIHFNQCILLNEETVYLFKRLIELTEDIFIIPATKTDLNTTIVLSVQVMKWVEK